MRKEENGGKQKFRKAKIEKGEPTLLRAAVRASSLSLACSSACTVMAMLSLRASSRSSRRLIPSAVVGATVQLLLLSSLMTQAAASPQTTCPSCGEPKRLALSFSSAYYSSFSSRKADFRKFATVSMYSGRRLYRSIKIVIVMLVCLLACLLQLWKNKCSREETRLEAESLFRVKTVTFNVGDGRNSLGPRVRSWLSDNAEWIGAGWKGGAPR